MLLLCCVDWDKREIDYIEQMLPFYAFFPLQDKERWQYEQEEVPEKQRIPSNSSQEEECQGPLSPTLKVCIESCRKAWEMPTNRSVYNHKPKAL